MKDTDRERFAALVEAKRNKGKGGGRAGHGDDDRHPHEKSAQVHQQFKRRKV